METGFLNCYDEEHFSTLSPSMIYDDQGEMLEDSDGSLLDMIPVDFYNSRIRPDPWGQDHEQELNGDIALLPGPIGNSGQSHRMEDYHKTLTDWQEHIGTLQNSDNDEMEIKGIFEEMDVVLAAYTGEDSSQEALFDETSFDADTAHNKRPGDKNKVTSIGKNLVGRDLPLGLFIKEELEEEEDGESSEGEEEDSFATAKFEMLDETNSLEDDFRIDADDDCVDVETVAGNEQMPVLEAGDLTSLLEQFEASETVNSSTNIGQKHSPVVEQKPQVLPRMPQQPNITAPPVTKPPIAKPPVTKPPVTKPVVVMTHQNIRDALPKEVIERIKASGRKKVVPLIPAMPSKKPRGGTRMQDAGAALSRNKLLKIVSGSVSGESIQLDHDYCSAASKRRQPPDSVSVPPRSFYHSNASEYGSAAQANRNPSSGEDSRRDSGLESGDASDASEETGDKSNSKTVASVCVVKPSVSNGDDSSKSGDKIVTIRGKAHNVGSIMETWNKTFAKVQNVPSQVNLPKKPLVSVLRKPPAMTGDKADVIKVNVSRVKADVVKVDVSRVKADVVKVDVSRVKADAAKVDVSRVVDVSQVAEVVKAEVKSKEEEKETKTRKKLNILEYRSRVKELDRCLDSCETTRSNSPLTPDPEEAQLLFDQATKLLMNCRGRLDDRASAVIAQTLREQARPDGRTIWVPPGEITLVEMAIEDGDAREADSALETSPEQTKTAEEEPPPTPVVVETEPEPTGEPEPKQDAKRTAEDVSDGTATSHARSRRQYRSRRADSSSSPSPTPEVTSGRPSKRRADPGGQRDRSPDRRARHCDRSPDRRARRSPKRRRSERSQSPSPSASSRSSCSSYSSQSRSSSRNRSRDWQIERSTRIDYDRNRRSESIHSYRSNRSRTSNRSWRRSRSPLTPTHCRSPMIQFSNEEKQRQVEERRVIYVGQIEESMSKAKLRELFEAFGHIVDISVHFREHGDSGYSDNYGFVTYALKEDAYKAVESGKRDPTVNKYELSFGGRRAFCKTRYSDLDGQRDEDELMMPYQPLRAPPPPPRPKPQSDDFDLLMKAAQARIMKRKA